MNYWKISENTGQNGRKAIPEYNQGELSGEQREKWRQAILAELPDKPLTEIHLLDVGTGPGFFAIILAEAGIQVTAVDYTEEMLKEAKANAGDSQRRFIFSRWMPRIWSSPMEPLMR